MATIRVVAEIPEDKVAEAVAQLMKLGASVSTQKKKRVVRKKKTAAPSKAPAKRKAKA